MAIFDHTLGILLHPSKEWVAIRNERCSFAQIFISHVPLLALIPCLSVYYGVTQVGWAIGDGDKVKLTVESALSLCVLTYISMMIGVYVLGEFINWMSKTYGVSDNKEKRHYESMALAVYVTIPVFLAGIVGVYPDVGLNALVTLLAASYSVYLIYEGIPILMDIPKERAFMYASSVVTVGLVLLVVVRVGSVLLWGMGFGPVYVD